MWGIVRQKCQVLIVTVCTGGDEWLLCWDFCGGLFCIRFLIIYKPALKRGIIEARKLV